MGSLERLQAARALLLKGAVLTQGFIENHIAMKMGE